MTVHEGQNVQIWIKFEPLQSSNDNSMALDAVKRHWMAYTLKIIGTGYHKLKSNKTPSRSNIILSYFPIFWKIIFHYILFETTGRSLRKSDWKSQIGHTESSDNHSAFWTWNRRAHCFKQKKGKHFFSCVFTRVKMGSLQDYATAWPELWQLCNAATSGHVASCKQLLNCIWFLWGHLISQKYTKSTVSQHDWYCGPWGKRSLWSHQNKCLSSIWKCLRRREWPKYWGDVSFSWREQELEWNNFPRRTAGSHT